MSLVHNTVSFEGGYGSVLTSQSPVYRAASDLHWLVSHILQSRLQKTGCMSAPEVLSQCNDSFTCLSLLLSVFLHVSFLTVSLHLRTFSGHPCISTWVPLGTQTQRETWTSCKKVSVPGDEGFHPTILKVFPTTDVLSSGPTHSSSVLRRTFGDCPSVSCTPSPDSYTWQ